MSDHLTQLNFAASRAMNRAIAADEAGEPSDEWYALHARLRRQAGNLAEVLDDGSPLSSVADLPDEIRRGRT